MTRGQAWMLGVGAILVALFLGLAATDVGCDVRFDPWGCLVVADDALPGPYKAGTDLRPVMYGLAGVSGALVIIAALTPWGRSRD